MTSVDFIDETWFCRWCGRGVRPWGKVPRLRMHHVVYEQEVRRRGGDVLDARNALALCDRCHEEHHSGAPAARRIPLAALRPENLKFARRLLGDYAGDYLAAHYSAADNRPKWPKAAGGAA